MFLLNSQNINNTVVNEITLFTKKLLRHTNTNKISIPKLLNLFAEFL